MTSPAALNEYNVAGLPARELLENLRVDEHSVGGATGVAVKARTLIPVEDEDEVRHENIRPGTNNDSEEAS